MGAPLTLVAAAVATAATLLLLISTHYSVAAAYAKTLGYHVDDPTYVPTFDATAYLQRENPSEMAAVQWIQEHTAPDALVLEGKGASYRANFNRISTMTGRPTLLGWDGHESQWRGSAYGTMVALRPETLQAIYSSASTQEITALLQEWDIAYVYVGPSEREQYRIDARIEERLQITMDLVFEDGNVRIYRRRG